MRKDKPQYEILKSLCGWWVIRVVDDHAQLIERFSSQAAAEDFMAFLSHANAIGRIIEQEGYEYWPRQLVS